MGFKKSEVSQLNSLASAIKLIEFDANKIYHNTFVWS